MAWSHYLGQIVREWLMLFSKTTTAPRLRAPILPGGVFRSWALPDSDHGVTAIGVIFPSIALTKIDRRTPLAQHLKSRRNIQEGG